jgi:hypothetical protein
MHRNRVTRIDQESLPSEVVRQATQQLEYKLSEEMRRKSEERREIDKSLPKLYAPLVDIVSNDKHAVEEKRRLRQIILERSKHRIKAPTPQTTPTPDSQIAIFNPPFSPWSWTDPNNTGRAESGTGTDGTFGGDAWSNEGPAPTGYGQAGAGQASYPVWSDGTSWLETHSGQTSVTINSTPAFPFVYTTNNYMLWFYSNWEADAGGGSMARCWVSAALPWVILSI